MKDFDSLMQAAKPVATEATLPVTAYTGILEEYVKDGYVPVLNCKPEDNRPATILEVKQIIEIALARSKK